MSLIICISIKLILCTNIKLVLKKHALEKTSDLIDAKDGNLNTIDVMLNSERVTWDINERSSLDFS